MSYTTIQLFPAPADPLAELTVSSAGAAGVLILLTDSDGGRLENFGLSADKARELAAALLAHADEADNNDNN